MYILIEAFIRVEKKTSPTTKTIIFNNFCVAKLPFYTT